METKQGHCPKCNSENLNYETNVNDGDALYYPYGCDDCGFEGREYYTLEFSCHWDMVKNEEVVAT